MQDDRMMKKAADIARKQSIIESARINRGLEQSLSSPEGRAFLWWLLSVGGYGAQPHTANALNTAFNCGQLQVAQTLVLRIAEIDPAGFVRMQHERIQSVNSSIDPDTRTAGIVATDIGDPSESGEWRSDAEG